MYSIDANIDAFFNRQLDDYLAQGHELDRKCRCTECGTLFRFGDRYESKAFFDAKDSCLCSPRCFILWYESLDNDIRDYQDMLQEK